MSVRGAHRLAGAVALCCALVAVAAPAPARALTIGIADQQASTFADPRLTALPVRAAHLLVSWDAMRYRSMVAEIDDWMNAATAAGMSPLVTFGRSERRKFRLPPTAVYAKQVRRFRLRYPQVREFSPWNEPNLAVHAGNSNPRRIASYYHVLRSSCPACKVLGADVVDTTSLGTWMRSYLRAFAAGTQPRLWGLHNYVDVNSTSSWGTRTMLRLAPGQIWFTETGAIIRRQSTTRVDNGDRLHLIRVGLPRAVAATRRVFALARTSPRITRVYIYHWKADRLGSWDSALVAANGQLRPSFDVFASEARRASNTS